LDVSPRNEKPLNKVIKKKHFSMSPIDSTAPWHNRPSIFTHIQTHLDEEGRLTKDGYELPDEALRNKDKPLRFAAGAMDGVFSHHVGPEETDKEATRMANLIKMIAEEDSLDAKTELYPILQEDGLVGLIDPTLQKMVEAELPIQPYLHNFARRLAFESPDRGAVKLGVAILGLIQSPKTWIVSSPWANTKNSPFSQRLP
jgi:hypothetical protein